MLKLLKKEEYPDWIKQASIRDEVIYLDEETNEIIWKQGTWESGTWRGGTWKDGIWESGTWESGTWEYGIWKNGFKRFVALTKWPIYYSQEIIKVGCQNFTVDEMIVCRDENKFPFEDEFTDDQRKEIKKAILTILFMLELDKNV